MNTVGNGLVDSDGVNLGQVNNLITSNISNIVIPTIPSNLSSFTNNSNLDINTHKIINLSNPTLSLDGANKNYVDSSISSAINNITIPTLD